MTPALLDRARLKRIRAIREPYQLLKFLAFQGRLARTTWADSRAGIHDSGGLPVPPPRLRFRVHWGLDRESFLRTGSVLATDVANLTASVGYPLSQLSDVLDFGCGCSRVMRFLSGEAGTTRFYGTDIDPEAIEWCAANIPNVRWTANDVDPPIPYSAERFDLVFSISVFTHLDEATQQRWLLDLHRIVRPGGIILLTVHGEHVYRT